MMDVGTDFFYEKCTYYHEKYWIIFSNASKIYSHNFDDKVIMVMYHITTNESR